MQNSLRKTEQLTKDHTDGTLNVCICYNSRDEIAEALSNTESEGQFEKNLIGGYNVKPDIMIRTSNEVRLSNFMLYQSDEAFYAFVPQMWPDFTLW